MQVVPERAGNDSKCGPSCGGNQLEPRQSNTLIVSVMAAAAAIGNGSCGGGGGGGGRR